jgi:ATP-dependent Zn protease
MTTAERQGCAYHEAGHAIVGKHLGRVVRKVQIGMDGDPSKGQTDFNDSVSLNIVDGLAICCAGFASERMFSAPLSERARFVDRYCAEKILQPVPEAQWAAHKRAGYRRAWRILSKNREAVAGLANRLIENGIVNYSG